MAYIETQIDTVMCVSSAHIEFEFPVSVTGKVHISSAYADSPSVMEVEIDEIIPAHGRPLSRRVRARASRDMLEYLQDLLADSVR